MNTKEFRQWVELFALQSGLSIDRIEALILNAISAYVAKVQSHGKGAYITKLENGQFETFREWELVADDCVMDDPERQWRVLDAVDEGFDEAEVGDTVNVLVASPEPSRTQPYPAVPTVLGCTNTFPAKSPKSSVAVKNCPQVS